MLIFVLPAIYPSEDFPQLGIYIKDHCQAISDNYGHTVVVLNASATGISNWNKCKEYKEYKDTVGHVYQKYTRAFMQSYFPRIAVASYECSVMKLLKKALNDYGKPDIIYAHFSFPSGYVARKISKRLNVPYVVDEHYSIYYDRKIHPYIVKITKRTIQDASRFVCVSNRLKSELYRHTNLNEEITVVPNLVHKRYQHRAPIEKDIFTFFSAGNFFPNKNFELLIDSFIEAFSTTENVQLLIAGDGELKEVLKTKIAKAKRGHQISLLGRIDSEKMLENYIYCDCFVLLSGHETFGIVYREAMAVGRPVITSKNGGIEEGWNNEYGLMIKDTTIPYASEALRYMYDNNDKYNSINISKACRNRYSDVNISKKINNILLSALSRDNK